MAKHVTPAPADNHKTAAILQAIARTHICQRPVSAAADLCPSTDANRMQFKTNAASLLVVWRKCVHLINGSDGSNKVFKHNFKKIKFANTAQ